MIDNLSENRQFKPVSPSCPMNSVLFPDTSYRETIMSQNDEAIENIEPARSEIPYKVVKSLAWVCDECNNECVPIRSESRCLCGHRLKEHKQEEGEGPYRCKNARCSCPSFFYIVAEGSWILRCRCKHRHTDHDPTTHSCKKPKCECTKFDSPWVCNCDHPWARHKQILTEKRVMDIAAMVGSSGGAHLDQASIEAGPAQDINRWDLINRGTE